MFRALCAHHQEVKIVLYYVLTFIKLYFLNIRPLTCFSVMIPDAV